MNGPTWRKSSRSTQNVHCVEVADLPGAVGVRDSKRPQAGHHTVTPAEWAAFVEGARGGQFDLD